MAHCSNCHTVAFTRTVRGADAHTVGRSQTDALGAHASSTAFEPTAITRTAGANPLYQYDNAVHPATLLDIFLNRVQYDDANGLLPVSSDPATRQVQQHA